MAPQALLMRLRGAELYSASAPARPATYSRAVLVSSERNDMKILVACDDSRRRSSR
jgi:hypothetical protein